MQHSILPLSQASSSQDNIRIVSAINSVHSLVVCNDLCVTVRRKLTSRFHVTSVSPNQISEQFDALVIDCRGSEITCSKNFDLIFALVNEESFFPTTSTEQDENIELITEAELDSDILSLRITSRLRARENSEKRPATDEDMVKENAYEILQALMQYSTDWMVVKDLDHRFALASNRFLQSHKKDADEVIGKDDLEIGTPKELVLGDSANNWAGYWADDEQVIALETPVEHEQMTIHENALEQAREHVAKVPIKNKNGDVVALLVCITQVNGSKLNGDNVSMLTSRQNIALQPIIKQLDDDRNKAETQNQKTQSAIKSKNNFIATASHDLRQPLQAISLFIEALEQKIEDSQQRVILSKMKQSSKDLTELLNGVLDISKLDADAVPVTKSHFSIGTLLQSIEDEFETEARKKSVAFHVNNSNCVVHTDSLLLTRLVKNLVSNAVRYTTKGSVNVLTEIDETNLIVRIKDTGPGIPKEQYQSIFSEFNDMVDQHIQPNFGH